MFYPNLKKMEYKEMNHINKAKIKKEVVYSELYNETRRYRDYELTAATWYTAILIALLGFLISAKYDVYPLTLSQICVVQSAILVLSTFLGVSSIYSIWYANKRYDQIWKIINKHLEPEWKKEAFSKINSKMKVKPRHLIYVVQALLVIFTWLFALWPKK